MEKPSLRTAQIWNMNFGFFGIQFGWGLQMANMSAIYEYLGASPDQIPMLWLAAPLTGMLVQPVIGHLSDRTWGRFGRRKPYFVTGALLSALALCAMPRSSSLLMAASLLWILDASINISMEPFRAFVADILPERQRTRGFAMQSLFIGAGAVLASSLPWLLIHVFGISSASKPLVIPDVVKYSFYAGSVVYLAAVLWTVGTTHEYPPDDLREFERQKAASRGIRAGARELLASVYEMPGVMKQLAWVQILTWLGLFCMWLYFPVATAHNVFGASDSQSPVYAEGISWAGLCFSMYSAVCFAFSFALPGIARRLGPAGTHSLCLLCGALGLLSLAIIHNKYLLLFSMCGVGIAWASILSMPYAILTPSLPPSKTGVYMGIFNFFIVTPEIFASLFFGWVMNHLLGNNRLAAVVSGGVFLMIAAVLVRRVKTPNASF